MSLNEETKNRMEIIKAAVNGCPFYTHMRMKLIEYDEGKSYLEMDVGPPHMNIYSAAHGGVAASLLDSASGLALATLLVPGQSAVTLDLRINYTSSVKQGLLTATGEIIHCGKTTAVGNIRVMQDDKLVAVGTATHFIKQHSPID